MAGLAGDGHVEAQLRGDAGDDADRQALGLQHRALLDVRLQVTDHVGRRARGLADARRIQSPGGQRVGHGHAGAVGHAIEIGRIEHAGDGAAGEHRGREARAFLVAEGDHLDRERQPPPGGVQRGHALDAQHHPERAVVAAGIAHAVDMAADQQRRRAGCVGFVAADQVGGRVDADRHAGLAHPVGHRLLRGAVGGREPGAVQAGLAVAVGRRAEGIAAGDGALAGGTGGRRGGGGQGDDGVSGGRPLRAAVLGLYERASVAFKSFFLTFSLQKTQWHAEPCPRRGTPAAPAWRRWKRELSEAIGTGGSAERSSGCAEARRPARCTPVRGSRAAACRERLRTSHPGPSSRSRYGPITARTLVCTRAIVAISMSAAA